MLCYDPIKASSWLLLQHTQVKPQWLCWHLVPVLLIASDQVRVFRILPKTGIYAPWKKALLRFTQIQKWRFITNKTSRNIIWLRNSKIHGPISPVYFHPLEFINRPLCAYNIQHAYSFGWTHFVPLYSIQILNSKPLLN